MHKSRKRPFLRACHARKKGRFSLSQTHVKELSGISIGIIYSYHFPVLNAANYYGLILNVEKQREMEHNTSILTSRHIVSSDLSTFFTF